jgi:hypothetical protein
MKHVAIPHTMSYSSPQRCPEEERYATRSDELRKKDAYLAERQQSAQLAFRFHGVLFAVYGICQVGLRADVVVAVGLRLRAKESALHCQAWDIS